MPHQPEQALAVRAAHLFIGGGREDHIPFEAHPLAFEREQGHQLLRHGALHIQRAAPPDKASMFLAAKRGMGPARGLGRHHVGVAVEQERRRFAGTFQPRNHVPPAGRGLQHHGVEALGLQDAGQVVGGEQFAAGRVDGLKAKEGLEMADGLGGERLGSHIEMGDERLEVGGLVALYPSPLILSRAMRNGGISAKFDHDSARLGSGWEGGAGSSRPSSTKPA